MAGFIADPDTYIDGPPHARFDALRTTEPVTWVEMDDEPGYWAVLRHADVVHVAKHSEVFSATEGGVVVENLDPVALETMRDMLLAMDPPRHTAYRKPVAGVQGAGHRRTRRPGSRGRSRDLRPR